MYHCVIELACGKLFTVLLIFVAAKLKCPRRDIHYTTPTWCIYFPQPEDEGSIMCYTPSRGGIHYTVYTYVHNQMLLHVHSQMVT